MEDLHCGICYVDFDDDLHIPRVISCGHTFCSTCIASLQQKSGKCPLCRIPLPQENTFPVNFTASNLIALMKRDPKKIFGRVESKRLMQRMEACKEALKAEEKRNKEYQMTLDHCINQLESSEGIEERLESLSATLSTFERIEGKVFKMEKALEMKIPKFRLNGHELGTFQEFLYKVYSDVVDGERINSSFPVNGEMKFGQVTVTSDLLLFHSLSSKKPENEDHVIELEGIKALSMSANFRLFLKIQYNSEGLVRTLYIKPRNCSFSRLFARLCTGELGPSYKGCRFRKGNDIKSKAISIMKIKNFPQDWKEANASQYFTADSESVACRVGSVVVKGIAKGGFQIYKITGKSEVSLPGVVGVVENLPDLVNLISYKEKDSFSVKGCGILFNLKV